MQYRMPDAYDQEGGVNQEKRFSVALQRYRDSSANDKMNPFAEQEAWEEHQMVVVNSLEFCYFVLLEWTLSFFSILIMK
ncbi:Pre-mRNA-splicing factor ATP-dependent RNA helicase DEAH1 [Vitis vinifera]|uniref:Pre-mRNA-splicing factor ATP-dependent RNA helicase DEAH1 n=1 Tax=Vitis vinifera TaxID=29760 RepID=A0A438D8C2_VITVI|nr:Pre-mRNA-splicing factor ATP-dependent RNA helicase DEAH1 [Vitis vinifera]